MIFLTWHLQHLFSAPFADDTKCYQSIESMEDGACLQRDFDHINQWCDLWQMELNQSKCGLLSITTNASSLHFPYPVSDVQVKTMETHREGPWDFSY